MVRNAKTRPFSVRFTDAELRLLRRSSGKAPLGAYIRSKVLEGLNDNCPQQSKIEAARSLSELGASAIAKEIACVRQELQEFRNHIDPSLLTRLESACDDISEMRRNCFKRLGLRKFYH